MPSHHPLSLGKGENLGEIKTIHFDIMALNGD